MSVFNYILSKINKNIPRVVFIDNSEIYYSKNNKKFTSRFEFTSEGIDLYFGEIRFWDNGLPMSDDERCTIKRDLENCLPKSWIIGWR